MIRINAQAPFRENKVSYVPLLTVLQNEWTLDGYHYFLIDFRCTNDFDFYLMSVLGVTIKLNYILNIDVFFLYQVLSITLLTCW